MNKFTRISAIVFALCLSAAVMTGCGDSNNDKKAGNETSKASPAEDKEEKELDEALDKLEQETAEELEKENQAAESAAAESEAEPVVEEIKYEATEEIKNAPLNSGYIQIGDTVFRSGGYMTAAELVEVCKDKFDTSEIHLDEYLPSSCEWYKVKSIEDPRIEVSVQLVKRREDADEKIKIPDTIVSKVEMKFFDGKQYCLTGGIGADALAYLENVVFFPMGIGIMDYDDIKAFTESQGIEKTDSLVAEANEYIESDDGISITVEGEENLEGNYPTIMYRFKFDPKTLKGTDLRYFLIDL